MSVREWQIGLFGTFDVQNYGDLLFPLVAEAELSKRLGPVKLHRFSYHAKTPRNGLTRSTPRRSCRI
jgi:lipopolysaccharide transport system ATP-binding protein